MLMAETPIPSKSVSPWVVALEVAVQHAFTLSNRQLIIRTGKVIHTDKLIAGFGQRSNGFLQDIQLLLGRAEIGIFDFALAANSVGRCA
jgi:hypothetical protein